ncbi:MAG: hypothetical protein RMJ44_11100 [Cytophagales bacterium]|nr:hypothetical protein [Bernardetiaceae bacterium]MDW8211622.1 hypothetical protein [Cytophagales bacterium]
MKHLLKKIVFKFHAQIFKRLEELEKIEIGNRFLLGCIAATELQRRIKNDEVKNLQEAEFQVFSQFGDDGIIQFLVEKLSPLPKVFIEFGVENYREANTRFLLMHNNWRGLVIDANPNMVEQIRRSDLYWRHDLTAISAFVTCENINDIFIKNGFTGQIGLLSIDIDGNDYWVWQAIEVVSPVIVVVEYNSVFGAERAISIPYTPNFQRYKAHFSGLYWGASLPAFCYLAQQKGYDFIGCNSAGNNAYFVRKDCNLLPSLTVQEGFVCAHFRESRDSAGNLTFLSGQDRFAAIKGCEVVEVISNKIEKI